MAWRDCLGRLRRSLHFFQRRHVMPPRQKQVNISRLLTDVPDIASLKLVGAAAPLQDRPVQVNWEGDWCADAPSVDWHKFPTQLVLKGSLGEVTLEKVVVTHAGGGLPLQGRSIGLALRTGVAPKSTLFRCYIASEKGLLGRICFPEAIVDEKQGQMSVALLPLTIEGGPLEIYYIEEGPYLICEGRRPTLEVFRRHVGTAKLFFSYLTGQPLNGRSCDVVLCEDELSVAELHWHSGRQSRRHIYSPIPVTWSEAGLFRESRGNPTDGKVLVPDVLSRCLQKLLDEPELETALEYIRLALEAPLEVRGVLLSVGLESLTAHLARRQRVQQRAPLNEAEWAALRADLGKVVGEHASRWGAERQDAAQQVVSRGIDGINRPTNRDKLSAPFTALSVPLSEAEAEAIDQRNRLLHSGRLLNVRELEKDRDAWKKAYRVEMRLYTAINKLLLRYLGYAGAVNDWGSRALDGERQATDYLEI